MKKLLLIFILSMLSCSKDDVEEQVEANDYVTIRYTDSCYSSAIGYFCATKKEYDNATIWMLDGVCHKIGLKDIDGNYRIEIFSMAILSGGCN